MKKQMLVCILFSLAFLLSCSGEDLSSNGSVARDFLPKVQKPNNRIDMEKATSLVEEAVAFLDKEHPSESKSSRNVNSVSVLYFGDIKSSVMKSGKYDTLDISDTLAYVFNFGDSLGYVIISNDARIESPLLAFTQKGSLVNGETDNPGLKLFLERLEGYMLESIAKFGNDDEQKAMVVAQKGPYSGSPLDTVVRPLVPVEWGQKKPYWLKLNTTQCPSGYYVTGCVATATAQIMSRWEYPTSLGSGTTYNWTTLNTFKDSNYFEESPTDNAAQRLKKILARNMVSDLFQQIGTGIYAVQGYMNYGCTESLAYTTHALTFLENNGFSSYNFTSYNSTIGFAKVKFGLSYSKSPFMANGCFYDNGIRKCHAWVIDGIAKNSSSSYYIHNNWGWDGRDNGYYPSGVFDPSYFNFQDVEIAMVSR